MFAIKIKDEKLTRCALLSEEEFRKQQQIKAVQDKLKRQFPGRWRTGEPFRVYKRTLHFKGFLKTDQDNLRLLLSYIHLDILGEVTRQFGS